MENAKEAAQGAERGSGRFHRGNTPLKALFSVELHLTSLAKIDFWIDLFRCFGSLNNVC